MNDAQAARDNGWTVGTRLVGDEGYGPTVIELTAIGRDQVLAVPISHNGKPYPHDREGSWTFRFRDWQVHEPPSCGAYSNGADGWACAATGPHDQHRNAAGDVTWPRVAAPDPPAPTS